MKFITMFTAAALLFSAAGVAAAQCLPVIEETIALPCDDCDGVALGDISRNGKMDILASSGKGCETFWYEQGENIGEWTKHLIYSSSERPCEIEGNDIGDFNGDGRLEAISLDQRGFRILVHRPIGDPTGAWETAVLRSDRTLVQASLVEDIDGDGRQDLVYTWEGDAPGRGGIHWLRFAGTDLMNPDHWEDRVMVRHESAWWLVPQRLDLNGNGRSTDIAFTARNIPSRNAGARPGVFWLEEPADVSGPWTRHTIDTTLVHPLHIDAGDLNGNGDPRDLVVGGFNTRILYWYDHADNWRRHAIPAPDVTITGSPDKLWNVKVMDGGVLSPVARDGAGGALVFFRPQAPKEPHVLLRFDYNHPMEDRIMLYDLNGDGRKEAVIPDSGTGSNQLFIFRLGCKE